MAGLLFLPVTGRKAGVPARTGLDEPAAHRERGDDRITRVVDEYAFSNDEGETGSTFSDDAFSTNEPRNSQMRKTRRYYYS